jgi:LysR family transcriptional regulator, cell division regulator
MIPSAVELMYFLEVATTENISRAAERLGVTQPTLSLALKRLENQIGAQLLMRYKTGVKLTKAGYRFQEKAKLLLENWQSILKIVKRDNDEISGSYSIGAHASIASHCLAKILPKLLLKHPLLELQLHHDFSRKITEKVINFSLDFGVVVNPVAHPDLIIRQVYQDEVGFFFKDPMIQFEQIREAILCYDPELWQSQWLLKKARDAGILFFRTLTSNSLETLAALCANGAGIAILPKRVVQLIQNPLFPILTELQTYQDKHTLIYRADIHYSLAAKRLARSLEKELQALDQ